MSVDVGFVASEFPNDNPALHGGVIWVCLEPTARPTPELVPRHEPVRAKTLVVAEVIAEICAAVDVIAETVAAPAVDVPPVEEAPPLEEHAPPTIIDVMAETEEAFLVEELTPLAPAIETIAFAPEPLEPAVEEHVVDDLIVEELEPLDATGSIEVAAADGTVVFESVAPPSIDASDSGPPPPSDDPFTALVCTLADVAISAGSPHVASLLPGLFFDARLPEALDADTAAILEAAGIWNGEAVEPLFIATVNAWRGILRGTSDDFSACGSMLDEWTSDLLARLLDTRAAAPRFRQELRTRGVAAFGLAA